MITATQKGAPGAPGTVVAQVNWDRFGSVGDVSMRAPWPRKDASRRLRQLAAAAAAAR